MKVVEPQVKEIVRTLNERDGDFWHSIELAARVCYHTEDRLTGTMEESESWVRSRLMSTTGISHNRALEFGTIYLTIPFWRIITILWYCINPYSRMTKWGKVTTNYRVIYEHHRENDLRFWGWTKDHAVRRTLFWTISRGIADEFRTHCSISSLMQSTRYCLMTKESMGGELVYVAPTFYMNGYHTNLLHKKWEEEEITYKDMVASGCTAQEAREVLPLSIRTEFIQCAFEVDWKRFFELRAEDSEHNRPHPDAKFIASRAKELMRL